MKKKKGFPCCSKAKGSKAPLEPIKSYYVQVLLTLSKTDTFATGSIERCLSNRESTKKSKFIAVSVK